MIGKLVEVTWRTGYVSVCQVVDMNDTHVKTRDYLFRDTFARASWKHRDHIINMVLLRKH
jgi:hypothetical protein